jgi:two-component system response regulator DesR
MDPRPSSEPPEPPPQAAVIRVVVAEDQAMMLGALAALLGMENDIRVVAQARNGTQALLAAREHLPDVLITDIEMP